MGPAEKERLRLKEARLARCEARKGETAMGKGEVLKDRKGGERKGKEVVGRGGRATNGPVLKARPAIPTICVSDYDIDPLAQNGRLADFRDYKKRKMGQLYEETGDIKLFGSVSLDEWDDSMLVGGATHDWKIFCHRDIIDEVYPRGGYSRLAGCCDECVDEELNRTTDQLEVTDVWFGESLLDVEPSKKLFSRSIKMMEISVSGDCEEKVSKTARPPPFL
jgi:hypothetical protein